METNTLDNLLYKKPVNKMAANGLVLTGSYDDIYLDWNGLNEIKKKLIKRRRFLSEKLGIKTQRQAKNMMRSFVRKGRNTIGMSETKRDIFLEYVGIGKQLKVVINKMREKKGGIHGNIT